MKKRKDPTSLLEEITPKIATDILANHNNRNRKLSRRAVELYAREILAKEWRITNQGIGYDWNGNLLDGQNRLAAVVMSGKTIRTFVTRGLDPDVFDCLDSGKKRTAGDHMHTAGYQKYASALAATVRMVKNLEDVAAGTLAPIGLGRIEISRTSARRFVRENETELYASVRMSKSKDAKSVFRSPALFAALHFTFSQHQKGRADDFFQQLIHGENLTSVSPIFQLRKHLLTDRASIRRTTSRFVLAAYAIKAWNAWLKGQTLSALRYSENDKWPAILKRPGRASAITSVTPKTKKGRKTAATRQTRRGNTRS